MDNKNPHSTWFWNDHDNEPGLRLCSLAAHGLWMRLLAIAARSPEHGIVQIGDQPSTLETVLPFIARGTAETVEMVRALIDELLTSGTASLDRKGRLYCRRMVRDNALTKKRSASGKKGADVTNSNNKRNEELARQKRSKPPGKEAASSVFGLPSSSVVDRSSPESAREDEIDDWPSGHDGAAITLRPPSEHRSRGQRPVGELVNGMLSKACPPERRLKRQDRAEGDLLNVLQTKLGRSPEEAWKLVISATSPEDPDYERARKECKTISRNFRLGWFPEESLN